MPEPGRHNSFLGILWNKRAGIWEWGHLQLSCRTILCEVKVITAHYYCGTTLSWELRAPALTILLLPALEFLLISRENSSIRTYIKHLGLLSGAFPCTFTVSHIFPDAITQRKGQVMEGQNDLPDHSHLSELQLLHCDLVPAEERTGCCHVRQQLLQGEKPIHHIAEHHMKFSFLCYKIPGVLSAEFSEQFQNSVL